MDAKSIHLDLTIPEDNIETGAVSIIKAIRPQWKIQHVSFKNFTDGITNKLMGCFNSEYPTDTILVRVYGQNTDLLIDRTVETENIKLLQGVGFAPPLYATFNNGLAYQYLPGEVLTVTMVRDVEVYPLIARKIAQMHRLELRGGESQEPAVWTKVHQFIDNIPAQYTPPDKHHRYVSLVAGGVEMLRQELSQLTTALSSLDSPVVFCHNDLLLANVIYRPGVVNFIDYEYAAYNYQAFDIGNHFTEFAGVTDVDFSRYPGEELQLDWLRVYLLEYLDREPTELELRRLYVQVNKFALAAHFLWAVWALVQAEHSTIDFDFLGYAVLRLDEYFNVKDSFLKMEMPR